MKVFFGAAIQGGTHQNERVPIYRHFIGTIKKCGYEVVTEHTSLSTSAERNAELEKSFGPLPEDDLKKRIYVRNKLIEAIEGDIYAAVFEVSTPSLGTGVELTHTYLRGRLGLNNVPVLALYEKDYWPNKLSTMIQGLTLESAPSFKLEYYTSVENGSEIIRKFFSKL